MSLRDVDLLLDSSMQRSHSLRVGDMNIVVPKKASSKNFLPSKNHEFLDVFDRNQANSLPPHRAWDHAIDFYPRKISPVS